MKQKENPNAPSTPQHLTDLPKLGRDPSPELLAQIPELGHSTEDLLRDLGKDLPRDLSVPGASIRYAQALIEGRQSARHVILGSLPEEERERAAREMDLVDELIATRFADCAAGDA